MKTNTWDLIPFTWSFADITSQNAIIKESMRLWGVMASRDPLVAPDILRYKEWTIPAGVSTIYLYP